jgi:hypothetical protein
MGSSYPSHEVRKGSDGLRVKDKVPVIGKHAVRDQLHGIAFEPVGQDAEKRGVVWPPRENRELPHASIDDVEE